MSDSLYAAAERFRNGFDRRLDNECWPWTKAITSAGYGCIRIDGKSWQAHRVAYILKFGELSPHLAICHSCDNRRCVNPAHLFAGTIADNNNDRHAKGRSSGGKMAGEANPRAKLTAEIVRQIYSAKGALKDVARRFGIDEKSVSSIRTGASWASVTNASRHRMRDVDGLTSSQRRLRDSILTGKIALGTIDGIEKMMKRCGWTQRSTAYRAMKKLAAAGVIPNHVDGRTKKRRRGMKVFA